MDLMQYFVLYCSAPTLEARKEIAFRYPVLMSSASISRLRSALASDAESRASDFEHLAEVDLLGQFYARHAADYPLGQGPVEQVWNAYRDGTLSLPETIRRAGQPEVTNAVGDLYVHIVNWQTVERARTPEWRSAVVLSRLLAEAALAGDESGPPERAAIESVTALTDVAAIAFSRGIDDVVPASSCSCSTDSLTGRFDTTTKMCWPSRTTR